MAGQCCEGPHKSHATFPKRHKVWGLSDEHHSFPKVRLTVLTDIINIAVLLCWKSNFNIKILVTITGFCTQKPFTWHMLSFQYFVINYVLLSVRRTSILPSQRARSFSVTQLNPCSESEPSSVRTPFVLPLRLCLKITVCLSLNALASSLFATTFKKILK